jgi:hypothetical protein
VDTSEPITTDTGVQPAATWAGGPIAGWTGYDLAAGSFAGVEVVLVGSPIQPGYWYEIDPQVSALLPSDSDLTWTGRFSDPDGGDGLLPSGFGTSIAIASDGGQIAVGAPDGAVTAEQAGTVFLLDELPDGAETAQPTLLLHGTLNRTANFGAAVIYVELGPDTVLVAGASGGDTLGEAGIYSFIPRWWANMASMWPLPASRVLLGWVNTLRHGTVMAMASTRSSPRRQ